jgi:hypothetical protein
MRAAKGTAGQQRVCGCGPFTHGREKEEELVEGLKGNGRISQDQAAVDNTPAPPGMSERVLARLEGVEVCSMLDVQFFHYTLNCSCQNCPKHTSYIQT